MTAWHNNYQICVAHIKNFKSSNVKYSNEEGPRLLGVQHLVDSDDHPQKHLLIDFAKAITEFMTCGVDKSKVLAR